jgi:AcrR family transcriptional regulator
METMRSVLEPTVPADVGVLSQRRRIIEAMIESCAEKTYAATTIADIVRRASISRTTFYKRFEGKRECFDAALDWCLEELSASAAGSYSPTDPPPLAIRKAIAAALELMAAKPALAQLALGEAIAVEPAVAKRYRALVLPALQRLCGDGAAPRAAHSDPRLLFGRAQVLVYNEILAGRTAELPQLLPDLVYIALLPFVGHEEAIEQARLAGGDASSGAR